MALSKLQQEARRQRRIVDRLPADPFVGTGQAAEIYGVAKTNLGRDVRDAGFLPAPFQVLPSGPIWLRIEIEAEADRFRDGKES